MRILYLANSQWPTLRGAEKLMLSLCTYARSHGHAVAVLAPAASALHAACGAEGIRSEAVEFTPSPQAVRRLRAVLRETRPDIVHGMSIFPVAYVRSLGLLPPGTAPGFFAHVTVDPTSALPVAARHFRGPLRRARNAVSRYEAPRLDAIFADSEVVVERLAASGIRGRVIPVSGHIEPAALETAARLPIDLPAGRPAIGFAGFLEPLKAIDDLITAFSAVAASRPGAVLLVAGEGPERQRLRGLARERGVGDRVFLLGYLDPVAPLLGHLDVYASASRSEALGGSILEAMTLGVPCVSTDSGGPSSFIDDGVNGLLVPVGRPDRLAAAIARLLDEPAFAARVARNGCREAREPRHLLSSTAATVFAEYERVSLGRSAGGGA